MPPRRAAKTFLAVVSVGIALVWVVRAAPTGDFLDRPLPKHLPTRRQSFPSTSGDGSTSESETLPVTSFWSGLRLLGALSGKTVRLPAGLTEWPDERTEKNDG